MLGRNSPNPTLFQMVDIESLVPADHKLRRLDAVLDLSFVAEVVTDQPYRPSQKALELFDQNTSMQTVARLSY